MALNPSGIMSIGGTTVGASINLELGLSATANSSIGQANFRELAKVSTGQISLSDFYGKSNVTTITIITNTTEYTLSPAQVPGYVAGQTKVQLTIGAVGSQTYLYSTDVTKPALNVTGFVTGDTIEIINNGFIIGMGGRGGSNPVGQTNGQAGGNAISISVPVTITNNLYIAGGGGGGAHGSGGSLQSGGGGGAGGGQGGSASDGSTITPGGAGGQPGMFGSDGNSQNAFYATGGGGGGGRIVPGTGGNGGTFSTNLARGGRGGGSGGGSGAFYAGDVEPPSGPGINGSAGGSANNPGVIGSYLGQVGGGGGGWGASGGNTTPFSYVGGVGGKGIALNGRTATITGPGIVYGAIS